MGSTFVWVVMLAPGCNPLENSIDMARSNDLAVFGTQFTRQACFLPLVNLALGRWLPKEPWLSLDEFGWGHPRHQCRQCLVGRQRTAVTWAWAGLLLCVLCIMVEVL